MFLLFFFVVVVSKNKPVFYHRKVGSPWRCGVLTTQGGIAGLGLGHLHGRELDLTLQSGVEAPRLLKMDPLQTVLLLSVVRCLVSVVSDAC